MDYFVGCNLRQSVLQPLESFVKLSAQSNSQIESYACYHKTVH